MITQIKRVTEVINPSVLITIKLTNVEEKDNFSRQLISQRNQWVTLESQKRRQFIRRI